MPTYKYKIDLSYIRKGQDPVAIDAKNIKSCLIDYDYNSAAKQPIVCVVCRLDRNLIDDIIDNETTNTMNFKISKVKTDAPDGIAEPYIDAECYYKSIGDKNPRKSKDYPEGSNKEVYSEISIGLSSKKLVEGNAKTTNYIVQKTNMLGAIQTVVKDLPILIEPLQFNKDIDQLIIPPQDSVNKAIAFLNDTVVFYDSPYRFYMDFNAVYLLSSKGTAIPMKGETYSTVHIDIRDPMADNAMELGISEDPTGKCYIIPMNEVDTHYNKDTMTSKDFNRIVGILNPSRKNSLPNVASDAVASAKNILSSLKQSVESVSGVITSTISQVNSVSHELAYQIKNVNKSMTNFDAIHNNAITELQSILKTNESILPESNKDKLKSILNALKNKRDGCFGHVENADAAVKDFDKFKMSTISTGYNVTSVTSLSNGIMMPNLADNISGMSTLVSKNTDDTTKNSKAAQDIHTNTVTAANGISDNMGEYSKMLTGLEDITITTSATGTGTTGGSGSAGTTQTIDFSKLRMYGSDVDDCKKYTISCMQPMVDGTFKAQSFTDQICKSNSSIAASVSSLSGLKSNLQAQTKNIATSWLQTENNIKSQIKHIQALKNVGISSLNQLKDLKKIKDLSSVGKLGIKSLKTKVNLPKNEGSSDKDKFVTLSNDDPNKIKSMQYGVELQGTLFKMTKQNIDNSILTINKEYTVSNTEQRKAENGKYLLVHKKEIYVREDDVYVCTTTLDFNKIPESK